MGVDPEALYSRFFSEGSVEQKERMQRMQGLFPNYGKDVFDVYYHFTHVGGRKVWSVTVMDSELVDAGFCKPNSPLEEKNEEAVTFPFAFYYWKPDRDNPF